MRSQRMMRFILTFICCLGVCAGAAAQDFTLVSPPPPPPTGGRIELNLDDNIYYYNGTAYVYLNTIKDGTGWSPPAGLKTPDYMDQNGNALPRMAGLGAGMGWSQPQAAERPGNYYITWAGQGSMNVGGSNGTNANLLACTGTMSGGTTCDNTPCNATAMNGYIAGNVLTITSATSQTGTCSLKVGVPITTSGAITSATYNNTTGLVTATLNHAIGASGQSVIVSAIGNGGIGAIQQLNGTFTASESGTTLTYTAPTGLCGTSTSALSCSGSTFSFSTGEVESTTVNQWGVPTIIAGCNGCGGASFNQSATCGSSACTGTGGVGTYLINLSQTIGTSSAPVNLTEGELMTYTSVVPDVATTYDIFGMGLDTSTVGDYARWPANVHQDDMQTYVMQNLTPKGALTSQIFRNFIANTGKGVLRDLGFDEENALGASRWEYARSTQSVYYGPDEKRPNIYLGTTGTTPNATYTFTGGVNQYKFDWYNATNPPADGTTILVNIPAADAPQGPTALFPDKLGWSGSGATDGVYSHVPVTTVTGSGTGAVISLAVVSGGTIWWTAGADGNDNLGHGYAAGDQISISLGGHTYTSTLPNQFQYNVQISIDNGATYHPITSCPGFGCGMYDPTLLLTGVTEQLTYDGELHSWVTGSATQDSASDFALNSPSPIAFAQINYEVGTNPWYVEPTLASTTGSDYTHQLALYLATNYPTLHPTFEGGPNEEWNEQFPQWGFATLKWYLYAANDGWSPFAFNATGDDDIYGKTASLVGQSVLSAYNDTSKYEIATGVQGSNGVYGATANPGRITSTQYVAQTAPPPAGYTLTPAYKYVTRIAIAPYWEPLYNVPVQAAIAYQWFVGNAAQKAAAMTAYFNTSDLPDWVASFAGWNAEAQNCQTNFAGCRVQGVAQYEGGANIFADGGDSTQAVTGATSLGGNSCQFNLAPLATTLQASVSGTTLTLNGGWTEIYWLAPGMLVDWGTGTGIVTGYPVDGFANTATLGSMTGSPPSGQVTMNLWGSGAVAGMNSLQLSGVSGGSWTGTYNNLVVSATTPKTITVNNLNCSGLGTLTGGTMTLVGSANWINSLRKAMWQAPQYDNLVTTSWNAYAANGGIDPSDFKISGGGAGTGEVSWVVTNFDPFGYWNTGSCDSCVMSTGSNQVTLAGNIGGIMNVGDTVLGAGMASVATGAAANTTITACALGTGSAPCGSSPGNIITLSNTPAANATGGINSYTLTPTQQLDAIRQWNGLQ